MSLLNPVWISVSLKSINHQLPSRSGRGPKRHSEDSSVHLSVPGRHSAEASWAYLKNNIIASKMYMLSLSLESEDIKGKKLTPILFRTTKLLPMILFVKSHTWVGGWNPGSLYFRPFYSPSTHPSPSNTFHRVTWWQGKRKTWASWVLYIVQLCTLMVYMSSGFWKLKWWHVRDCIIGQ